jgi:hypothetical protein
MRFDYCQEQRVFEEKILSRPTRCTNARRRLAHIACSTRLTVASHAILTSSSRLGAPLGVAADTMRRNERVGRSIVHFVFRYRPLGSYLSKLSGQHHPHSTCLAILQATGIAPLPPRTEATPPRDTDSLASRSQSPPPAPELTQAELDEEQRLKVSDALRPSVVQEQTESYRRA